MIDQDKKDWADWLAIAQFSYNDRVHSVTGYSPMMIVKNNLQSISHLLNSAVAPIQLVNPKEVLAWNYKDVLKFENQIQNLSNNGMIQCKMN